MQQTSMTKSTRVAALALILLSLVSIMISNAISHAHTGWWSVISNLPGPWYDRGVGQSIRSIHRHFIIYLMGSNQFRFIFMVLFLYYLSSLQQAWCCLQRKTRNGRDGRDRRDVRVGREAWDRDSRDMVGIGRRGSRDDCMSVFMRICLFMRMCACVCGRDGSRDGRRDGRDGSRDGRRDGRVGSRDGSRDGRRDGSRDGRRDGRDGFGNNMDRSRY